ncbi:pectate lyase, partial [Xanthomonas oryzae pv. oryzae]
MQHFSPLQTRVFSQNTGSRNFCTINGLLGCPSIRCANSRSLEVLHLTLETALRPDQCRCRSHPATQLVVLQRVHSAFTPLGNGAGFKAGGYGRNGSDYPKPVPRHIVQFNPAVGNRSNGLYANHHIGGQEWISNTSIKNGRANYDMQSTLSNNVTDVSGYDHHLANNLGFGTRIEMINLGSASENDIGRNSFNLLLVVSAGDFVSLDESQLMRPRQANGDLPIITFATLAPGSALI